MPEPAQQTPKTRISNTGDSTDSSVTTFTVIGWVAALAAAITFGGLGLTGREDTTIGLVVVPMFAVGGYLALQRLLRAGHGARFAALMFAALGVRFLAAVPRFVSGADSPVYQREGVRIARSLRNFDFGVPTGRSVPGTGAVRYFSGVVNVFTGSSFVSTFLVFTLIAFIGQVFFLLGVKRALNPAQFRLAAFLVAFSPTMAYWPSSIGKESIALFGVGLGVYGASRMYDRHWSGVVPVLLGLFSVGMVRPHVAMVLLAGVLTGLMARRAHTRGRIATHTLALLVVVVGSMWAANASANLFGLESIDGFSDVSAALDFTQNRTSQDNAEFTAARVESVVDYPAALITVLFRPFPWEARSAAALISAAEGILLIALVASAIPGLLVGVRDIMQRGTLLLGVAFTGVFIYLFSAIGNFGILSRQRSQVIPFVLLFVAFGLRSRSHKAQRWRRR